MQKKSTIDANAGKKAITFAQKMLNDKVAICKCIREKGNIHELAQQRGITFVKPL